MECGALGPKGDKRTYCQFCLSPLSSRKDRICSKSFLSDNSNVGPQSAAKELQGEINEGLIKIQSLPKEGFDIFEFHRKHSKKDSCNYNTADLELLEKQLRYLQWKIHQIKSGNKSCAD